MGYIMKYHGSLDMCFVFTNKARVIQNNTGIYTNESSQETFEISKRQFGEIFDGLSESKVSGQ